MITRVLTKLAFVSLLASSAGYAAEAMDGEAPEAERIIRSGEGFSSTRDPDGLRSALVLKDLQADSRSLVVKPKGLDSTTASPSAAGDFWFYSADTELFFDNDGDGYYHYLRVRFDADTFYTDAYVYAELYVSWDGETWEQFHVTEDFLIQGSSSFDEYEVETEFVTGYPSGLYDVLIELYDADFGTFVDEFGPFQSSAFSLLPIEDLEHDGVPTAVVTVSHENGGSGAISFIWLALLLTALGAKWMRSASRLAGRPCTRSVGRHRNS